MKKVSLFLMLTMIITVFTACNDTKEQDQDSKDYILVGNHSPIKSSFGMLINGGGQENGQFPYMLVLGGGVDVTEYLSLAEGLVANAPNDMSLLMLFVSSSSPNSIPSGTYTYKESDYMLPFSIHMGTALYIAKDYEFYSDDLEASESFGEYEIVSATMEVKHEDDIYDITFAGVLDNGEEVRGYYKGKITYSNGGNDAPAMIK